MIERRTFGTLPVKHHTALRDDGGRLLHEECLTRQGFDGPYTIMYHRHGPQAARPAAAAARFAVPGDAPAAWRTPSPNEVIRSPLAKRLFQSGLVTSKGGAPLTARVPLLFNDDVVIAVAFPDAPDPVYFANGDADDLHFIWKGSGLLRSVLGDLPFSAGDYVIVPRGIIHRFIPDAGVPQHWLSIECKGGIGIPRQWRNDVGQLRMDAPYCHRDFRATVGRGPLDENIRHVVVKRSDVFSGLDCAESPLDVVGWDGSVYPFGFPILNFQPRVGLVHLPPTWHGTFQTRGALICSFVPRPLDFHLDAIPCPYPHTSVDCDEVIFYCDGQFTSRRGVGPGSLSHHPAGVTHGPHPGAYEASLGATRTNELAVMLDTYRPLQATAFAMSLEEVGYAESFVG
jgi:homogentisate 1,2-dioxygenase